MADNLFKKHAKLMGSVWKKAKAKADSGQLGDIFEDGKYKFGVTDAQATESKKGDFMVVFSLTFLDGEYIGKVKRVYRVITPDKSEDNLARILLDINKLGFEIEDFEQIESALEEIREKRPVIRATLKTRSGSDYQDAYIDKVLTGEEAVNIEDAPNEGSEVPTSEESVDIGSVVLFPWKGEELEGTITEFYENDTKAKVKVGKLIYPVKVEDLSVPSSESSPSEELPEEIPEEPQEPEPEPEPEPVRKTTRVVKKTGRDLKKKRK